jgi:hypothetical protein
MLLFHHQRGDPFMRLSFIQTLLAIAGLSASLANAGTEQISVTRTSGAVTAIANGVGVAARVGAKLTPPVTITTGADGAVHLEQNSAALDIGPNSIVELRDTLSGAAVLQRGGRVMYTVRPRKSRDFSVETPYLVAVVKGTVFTVAVADAATQVTLVEGSVELQSEGIAEAVLLQPNQTAKRAAGERSIRVTTIDTTPPTQANPERSQPTALNDATATPVRFGELATSADLNEIAATRLTEQRTRSQENPPSTPNTPSTPASSPTTPIVPPPPATPTAPTIEPTPGTPGVPITPPATQVPDVAPIPNDDGQDNGDDNNGNGNDDDRDDDGNPGRNRGKNRAR